MTRKEGRAEGRLGGRVKKGAGVARDKLAGMQTHLRFRT